MCRILFAKENKRFNVNKYLLPFSEMCMESKEYQGHGWGFSFFENNNWKTLKQITPIWESELPDNIFSTQLVVHARSAFEDKGIVIENNMPFGNEKTVFTFNGELRKTKLNIEGRIGAEKIFNFINRLKKDNYADAIERAVKIIEKRTEYIRAMNFIISQKEETYIYSDFNEDENYFTLQQLKDDKNILICSQKLFQFGPDWHAIPKRKIRIIK